MTAGTPAARLTRAVMLGGAAFLAGALVVRMTWVAGLLTASAIGLGGVLLLATSLGERDDEEARRRILRWTVGAFVAHLAFGLLVGSTALGTRFFGGDAVTYHEGAKAILLHWTGGGVMPHLPAGKEGFYFLLAGIYWVFGPHQAVGMAVNAALAAGLVPVLSDNTRRLFGERAARYVPQLVVLLPGLFLWTSQLLKEAPILFFIAVAVNCAVRMSERFSPGPIVLFGVCTGLLLTFRGHVGIFVAAGLVAGVMLGRRELASGLATGAVVVGLSALVVFGGGVGESGYQTVTAANLQKADVARQGLALAGSGFGQGADISTSGGAIRYLPVGLLSFGLGPFPWQAGGLRQLIAIPDVLVWWWLLPKLWAGYQEARRGIGRRALVLALPALSTLAVLALVISNYGTVVREREQIVVVLIPLIALGLAAWAEERAGAGAGAALHRSGVIPQRQSTVG